MTAIQFLVALAGVSAALSVCMAAAWVAWRLTGNSGWVDTTWTFGLGLTGCIGALAPFGDGAPASGRQILVAVLIAVWSLRLGLHIAQRTAGITDDPRYARLVREWGADAPARMFGLLQKQALVSIPLAIAMVLAARNPQLSLRAQDGLAVLILMVGIVGEAVADGQLRRFRADPANAGRVCDHGLWGCSRHPNYFFEWFGWLAWPLFAIEWSGGYPWGFAALAGPACMYWLLVHVSGIPPLEEHMLERRGERFRAYQARTSAFFPAPPRTMP